ncbi:hypothetical protein BKA82DRAFT_4220261 [Pisolithus tinctorius]|uniref:Uncharacterized protein n=1 Tax=Pisolithus tinctorius Marx 270 TaxID=870435 RepID=A0A0C3JR88_PISTI|nr:hypothetical protein BKA82DRAFT_4220261 [Pisolithus tinctorius]KIN99996.1 hypothetical protein M404DRAFT_153921 [Pisolithus tinctorius Marx 270]
MSPTISRPRPIPPPPDTDVPDNLQHATLRLNFPPSYVIVGVYRLFTDKSLYKPAWDKCKHGVRRGAIVGFIWTCFTYDVQKRFVRVLLNHPSSIFYPKSMARLSKTATDLSEETFMGIKLPLNMTAYVTAILIGTQVTAILTFFLSRNIRVARRRVWDQTVTSRGKGPDFWQPYVEEWEVPPVIEEDLTLRVINKFGLWIIGVVVKKVIIISLSLYPFMGTIAVAALKSMETARYLHQPYFKAKKMTPHEVAVFTEERKWDYRLFGFTAALLEGLPIVGLIFTVSNRIGAAMWAHDLEKRQHYFASLHVSQGVDASVVDAEKMQ